MIPDKINALVQAKHTRILESYLWISIMLTAVTFFCLGVLSMWILAVNIR